MKTQNLLQFLSLTFLFWLHFYMYVLLLEFQKIQENKVLKSSGNLP